MRQSRQCGEDFKRDFPHRSTELKQKRDYAGAAQKASGPKHGIGGGDINGVNAVEGRRLVGAATLPPRDAGDEENAAAFAGGEVSGGGNVGTTNGDRRWPPLLFDWNE